MTKNDKDLVNTLYYGVIILIIGIVLIFALVSTNLISLGTVLESSNNLVFDK
jgi:hypothetical protein